jgi:hypothetical protein
MEYLPADHPMQNSLRRAAFLALAAAACGPVDAVAQSFAAGSVYLMSAIHELPPNMVYPGIRRVDPATGQTQPFVQFNTNAVYPCSAAYDPYRQRVVAWCGFGALANPALFAFDAAGNGTVVSTQYLVRLAPRGDGKIYGYLAGAANPDIQQIRYLDAADQMQVLLDVGGGAPWLLNGGVPVFGDPIRSMIYDPVDNALLVATQGDNSTPTCSGSPVFDVAIRKLPLTPDGTRLRAPAVCTTYSVSNTANVHEQPLGFSYGPNGSIVLAVYPNWSGALPRLLSIDPVTLQVAPFATVGPYFGDVAMTCGAYCPSTGRALILDGGNDVFRSFAPGQVGEGNVLASYGSPGLGGSIDTLFVVGPIGGGNTLTADGDSVSVGSGGVQHLDFHPGAPFAGQLYVVLGSMTGWYPGSSLLGQQVPLNFDFYTNFTTSNANSAVLVNTLGVLGPAGTAQASIVVPPGVLSFLAGLTLHHAAITADAALAITHVSNPVALQLVP